MIQAMTIALHILEALGIALVGVLLIWLKYWQIKSANDSKDHKADVQTIFSGKK
jgi:NhaP-type Na+/H+ or K+/H+ antiporter